MAEADGTMQELSERVRAEHQNMGLIVGRKAPCTSFYWDEESLDVSERLPFIYLTNIYWAY